MFLSLHTARVFFLLSRIFVVSLTIVCELCGDGIVDRVRKSATFYRERKMKSIEQINVY